MIAAGKLAEEIVALQQVADEAGREFAETCRHCEYHSSLTVAIGGRPCTRVNPARCEHAGLRDALEALARL